MTAHHFSLSIQKARYNAVHRSNIKEVPPLLQNHKVRYETHVNDEK
jgi:hypothetical protein